MRKGQLSFYGLLMWLVVFVAFSALTPLREAMYTFYLNATGATSVEGSIITAYEPILALALLASFFIWLEPRRTAVR